MKVYGGVMYRSRFCWPRHLMEVCGHLRPGRFILGETALGTLWIGGWVVPRVGLDGTEKRQFLTLPGSELRPARSQSLYRLSYRGSEYLSEWRIFARNVVKESGVHVLFTAHFARKSYRRIQLSEGPFDFETHYNRVLRFHFPTLSLTEVAHALTSQYLKAGACKF
jgi:hypothetical protein